MNTLMLTLLNAAALLMAAVISYVIGTTVSSIFVLRALPTKIPFGTYAETAWFDITHLVLYFMVVLIGFLVAFPIAAWLRKILPKLAKIGYPLAGAVAIGTALGLMYTQFETIPISGATSPLGFIAQLIAGAFGGWVFGKLQSPLKP